MPVKGWIRYRGYPNGEREVPGGTGIVCDTNHSVTSITGIGLVLEG
jgi:hypothetical protein